MPKQLLIYERITPIDNIRHATWSATDLKSFAFAAEINSVPLMTSEFGFAAPYYPIVFAADGQAAHPVSVLGIAPDENLFVGADAAWHAPYIPAYIRRYPFVFSSSPDGASLTLCIDEAYAGFDPYGRRGDRLFDDAGQRTPFLDRALDFANAFQIEHRASAALGQRLIEWGLLEDSQASFTLPGGITRSLTGFHCVSRARLKALDPARLHALAADDTLELIYLHLHSMRNFDALLRLASEAAQAAALRPAS